MTRSSKVIVATILVCAAFVAIWLHFDRSYRDCLDKYDEDYSAADGMDRMMRQPPDESRAADNCSNGNVLPDFLLY